METIVTSDGQRVNTTPTINGGHVETAPTVDGTERRKRRGRVGRFLLGGALVLIVAGIVAHLAWKYSGSNQWKKTAERKGVTLYTMKSPGAAVEKFKAVWKIHSKLGRFVMWATDAKGDSMRRESGLYDLRVLDRQNARVHRVAWKQPLASFLEPRQFVTKNEFSQNPTTKVLLYAVSAIPDAVPPDDCCVRVQVMDNSWTLTPLKDGEIEVEWYVNMDIGGSIPYFLQNSVQPGGMMRFAPKVESFIEIAKYKNAQFDWLREAAVTGQQR